VRLTIKYKSLYLLHNYVKNSNKYSNFFIFEQLPPSRPSPREGVQHFPLGKMKGGLFRKNKEYVNTGYGSLNEYIKTLTAQRVNLLFFYH